MKRRKRGVKSKEVSRRTLRRGKQDSKKVVLVDCSSVIYAAFHAIGYLSYDGQPTNVIYGFLSRLLQMAEKFKTNDFIFCWDAGASHRHLAYPQYKQRRWQKREEMQADEKLAYDSLLLQTLQLNHEILPRMGFRNSFIKALYEADDILAHWTNRLSEFDYDIIMVTTDADMYQCLDKCRIWFPTKKKYFARKNMLEKYNGTTPEQWAMAKAIGGCQGDGVKGIEGISDPKNPKSKVHKYLRDEMGKGKVLDRINSREGQAIIERNLPLVTVPFMEDIMPKMIRRKNIWSRKRFIKQFDRFHFISFLKDKNFKRWEKAFDL